ncbi:MAG: STAS domain-containing protein [Pseudonocardiaceae bacterium]
MSNELLHVHYEQIGDQIVVHAHGEVDLATAPLLDQVLRTATGVSGARRVVVNLTEVGFFGAIGLAALLTATRHGDDTGIPIVIVTHPGQPPHRMITIIGLHSTLVLVDSLDHALTHQ